MEYSQNGSPLDIRFNTKPIPCCWFIHVKPHLTKAYTAVSPETVINYNYQPLLPTAIFSLRDLIRRCTQRFTFVSEFQRDRLIGIEMKITVML